MEIKIRDFVSEDIFPMMKIINKIGINDVLKVVKSSGFLSALSKGFESAEVQEASMAIGLQLVDILFEKMPECHDELFRFVASVANITVEEAKKIPMADFADVIMDIVTKAEFKDFFMRIMKRVMPVK